MKLYFQCLFIFCVVVSCRNGDEATPNACASGDLNGEVSWIEDLKGTMTNCTCEVSIIKGTYQGQTVIFISITDPLCNSLNTPTLFSCTGEIIRTFTDSEADQKDLVDKVTRDSILYSCKT